MKKHSLSATGLSMSQAQSISNLCYQRALDISNILNSINNAEKTLKIGNDTYTETVGKKIPENVIDLILEKGKLHATQAFLMENIKAKDSLLKELKAKCFNSSSIKEPEYPTYIEFSPLSLVTEDWAWSQLSASEYSEFLEAEAYSAHIGQFIHKDCKLDILRKELSSLKTLEWMVIEDGKKTPLKVAIHHTNEDLLKIHNLLAVKHRNYEQRVNYFKAKIKNLVTEENARISKENAINGTSISNKNQIIQREYNLLMDEYQSKVYDLNQQFEESRYNDTQVVAKMRINVDVRFQDVIDLFLKQLD